MPTAIQAENKATRRIGAREAAAAAFQYFKELFPSHEVGVVTLEEVELTEDGKNWLITLGYEFRPKLVGIAEVFGPPKTKFKVFKVDAKTGHVIAMKIRKLE